MNREVENSGLQMTAEGQNFELSCVTTNNPQDTKYMNLYNVVAYNTGSNAIVWKMTSVSNMENYSDLQDGIQPGTSGMLSFVIKPKTTSLNLNFELEVIGYKSGGTRENPTMTEIPNSDAKNNMNGHIIFFEDCSAGKYSGFIAPDQNMTRHFSKTFNGEETVDICWVWPEYLQKIVKIDSTSTLVDRAVTPDPLVYTTDYVNILKNISDFPQFYFKGNANDTFLSALRNMNTYQTENSISNESQKTVYCNLYDEADNSIGTNVEYILVKMEVTEGGST